MFYNVFTVDKVTRKVLPFLAAARKVFYSVVYFRHRLGARPSGEAREDVSFSNLGNCLWNAISDWSGRVNKISVLMLQS